jgi:hypothetical protein
MRDLAGRSMVTAGGWSLFLLFEGETGPLWWLAFLGLEMGVVGSLAVFFKLVTGRREKDGSGEDRRDRAVRRPKGDVWAMLGFAALGALLFFSFAALLFEARSIENTLGGSGLFWGSLVLGGLAAGGSVFLGPRWFLQWAVEAGRDVWVALILVVIGGFCTAAATSAANRGFAGSEVRPIPVCVEKKLMRDGRGGKIYYLFVMTEDRRERLIIAPELWESVGRGDAVTLFVRDGGLVATIVSEVRRGAGEDAGCPAQAGIDRGSFSNVECQVQSGFQEPKG